MAKKMKSLGNTKHSKGMKSSKNEMVTPAARPTMNKGRSPKSGKSSY